MNSHDQDFLQAGAGMRNASLEEKLQIKPSQERLKKKSILKKLTELGSRPNLPNEELRQLLQSKDEKLTSQTQDLRLRKRVAEDTQREIEMVELNLALCNAKEAKLAEDQHIAFEKQQKRLIEDQQQNYAEKNRYIEDKLNVVAALVKIFEAHPAMESGHFVSVIRLLSYEKALIDAEAQVFGNNPAKKAAILRTGYEKLSIIANILKDTLLPESRQYLKTLLEDPKKFDEAVRKILEIFEKTATAEEKQILKTYTMTVDKTYATLTDSEQSIEEFESKMGLRYEPKPNPSDEA